MRGFKQLCEFHILTFEPREMFWNLDADERMKFHIVFQSFLDENLQTVQSNPRSKKKLMLIYSHEN